MDVVVVESPAKAKTITKYLGGDVQVLASYGHVRDLPPKDGSVRPDEAFAMDWQVADNSEKQVRAIAQAVKKADRLILATDPDREGEAISWHVLQVLQERNALGPETQVHRVTFNAITKTAVQEAMASPRALDQALIQAYLARRALDYLVGFTLSPVLWHKLPGSRSAGRVQSVALRLICDREDEIEAFKPQEYWSLQAHLSAPDEAPFTARLTHLRGEKLDKLSLGNEGAAADAKRAVKAATLAVQTVERKRVKRNPSPPFTTSTLQQEAARKLYFSAKRTMQVAQKLYEGITLDGETVGLITYMRTDGVQMAGEAIAQARSLIGQRHGDRYLPDSPRVYKTKAKNAQEAHEAIRPTDLSRDPASVAAHLDTDQRKLYELIWKRTLASQMASAELDQVAADIGDAAGTVVLRATGSVLAFDGFMALYREDRDDSEDDDKDRILPPLTEGDAIPLRDVVTEQHFTQPPPRFSEASLVKRMEELGIGRPSTYASIISVLQDRDYVRLDSRRFIPEDRGRIVTVFLKAFFARYVQNDFTAELETQLDDVSDGRLDWRTVLETFWKDFKAAIDATGGLSISDVLDALNKDLAGHFFPTPEDGGDARVCPRCGDGLLGIKLGRSGGFIGCSNYPECRYTRPLGASGEQGEVATDRTLGTDPETGLPVLLRNGPYGPYVQLGDTPEGPKDKPKSKKKAEAAPKPKRASLPKGMDAADLTLETALALLRLPRDVGLHPQEGTMIQAGIGRFGPYIRMGATYVSLPGADDVLTIGLNRSVDLLAEKAKKTKPAKTLGDHPKDGKPVTQHDGRYGPYVQHGTLRATIPKSQDPDSVDLTAAVALLAAKAAKGGTGKSGASKKTTTKKKTTGARKSVKAG